MCVQIRALCCNSKPLPTRLTARCCCRQLWIDPLAAQYLMWWRSEWQEGTQSFTPHHTQPRQQDVFINIDGRVLMVYSSNTGAEWKSAGRRRHVHTRSFHSRNFPGTRPLMESNTPTSFTLLILDVWGTDSGTRASWKGSERLVSVRTRPGRSGLVLLGMINLQSIIKITTNHLVQVNQS